ncbi:C2H2 finger domain-containing protein [Histoplasma capsulatum var. duboisii H88]|uniref:RING-type E3 ubiquitin transferase n=1 Tax=Ajellomyces capsulatus (strain H88) TaxID=544711 RepID=F0UTD8_AJEC8|nr:C2H2 finger domain-containing protein [Histoplasma capsulatum var. duboisii H88]QSS54760.1 C2H2 finger domain-containing protein [Histoplasma capsulatum var. duboisii H88]
MAEISRNTPHTSPPQRDQNPTRGNRRQRGGASANVRTDTHQRREKSGGRGGRGGGGRGSRGAREGAPDGRRQTRPQSESHSTIRSGQFTDGDYGEPPGSTPRSGGTSGDRLAGDAKRTEGEGAAVTAAAAMDEEADTGEVCFICASSIDHTAVAPCNHRTCHICALRLRALYKTKACAHCRTEWPFVIFTDDLVKKFEDFRDNDFIRTDDNLGIKYETNDIFEDTVLLLRYNCPDTECDVACLGWPDLHRHVKSQHHKVMCDLCTRNKKVFTHEHELFSMTQLRKHEKYGDDNPGAIDQSGFKGHPECGFCRQRFYGDDELYTHCRDKHERCHICDRRNGSRQHQYYINYNSLEDHFSKDHFLCLDKECLEKKFVVFESQLDLKAHQLECHPAGLSKDARREARTVDLSTFDYRTPYQPQRGGREGRGAGRGRDPNAETLPVSSAQPLRRDELAYQRQIAIQSAQSVTSRTFGGQLTPSGAQTVRVPPQSTAPPPSSTPAALPPAFEALDLGRPNATPSTPQEQARKIAHGAVMARATSLLRNDSLKVSEFRNKVSSYRTGAINAPYLIESFFSLFDASSSELGTLIKELAELYDDNSKRTALLKAWNDWRAINEDYPALPGPNGVLSNTSPSTSGGGKRVLRLKSSTAQSSRSAVGRSGSLLGTSNGISTSSNPFPPLGGPTGGRNARTSASPWSTVTPPSRSAGSSPAPSRPSLSSGPKSATTAAPFTRGTNADAFPALPAAPKPNTLMAGLTRGTVRWGGTSSGNAAPSPWGRGGVNPTPAEAVSEGETGDGGEGGGKKGKGKKGKQVLYHFG